MFDRMLHRILQWYSIEGSIKCCIRRFIDSIIQNISNGPRYYGDSGSGGHCGGSELGNYGTGQSWIDGLYVATSSHMWCGNTGAPCGNTHADDCGRCYEVQCTGTDTNTDGYTPCNASPVTVAVTDECPGSSEHCGGAVNHFDLSTKAYKKIADTRAGAIRIKFRRVQCSARGNMKLKFHGTRWHFKVAAWDVNGPGTLSGFAVKSPRLGRFQPLAKSYGAFFVQASDIGDGPYEFRLTADDGQVLMYQMNGPIQTAAVDIGQNFAAASDMAVPSGKPGNSSPKSPNLPVRHTGKSAASRPIPLPVTAMALLALPYLAQSLR